MNTPSSGTTDPSAWRGLLAWMTLPLSLFPLVALLTYDWRAVPELNNPPPLTNFAGSAPAVASR